MAKIFQFHEIFDESFCKIYCRKRNVRCNFAMVSRSQSEKKKISSFYTDPPSFEHSCELHVHNSCMLLSPCRCIEKIARHAQEHLTNCWPLEKEKGPFCHLLFPRCLQSDTNFRYIFSPNNC